MPVLWVDVGQGSECCKKYLGDKAGTARFETCGETDLYLARARVYKGLKQFNIKLTCTLGVGL